VLGLNFAAIAGFHYDVHRYITTTLVLHQELKEIVNHHNISSDNDGYLFVLGQDFRKLSLGIGPGKKSGTFVNRRIYLVLISIVLIIGIENRRNKR